jgi:hypothetical protein
VNGGPRPRRPLRTRGRSSAAALAGWLRRRRIEPNQISVASIAVAAGGAVCFVALPHVGDATQLGLLAAAAALVQLRLLANLMDGMLAIEGGSRKPGHSSTRSRTGSPTSSSSLQPGMPSRGSRGASRWDGQRRWPPSSLPTFGFSAAPSASRSTSADPWRSRIGWLSSRQRACSR